MFRIFILLLCLFVAQYFSQFAQTVLARLITFVLLPLSYFIHYLLFDLFSTLFYYYSLFVAQYSPSRLNGFLHAYHINLCHQGDTRLCPHAQRVVRHMDSIKSKDPSPNQNTKLKMQKALEIMSQKIAMRTRGEHKLPRMLGIGGTQ